MRTIRLFTLAALLASTLPGQSCLFLPADSPAVGTPDPRPLGNGNPADPTYGTMRYQVQIPTSVLGTQDLDIIEVFVAPADSQVRTFTDLQVRMGHNPNPLTTQMVFNMVGFTARPVQHTNISWSTTADEWTPLGMAFPFGYRPANGMLVLEFFVRDAGASGGAGVPGLRTDPSIPFVWTSGQGYNGTLVAGGGLKLRFCTNYHGFLEYHSGACPGSSGLPPRLGYGGSAQIGNTVQIELDDGPSNSLAILVYSFVPRVGPVDLAFLGAPGCGAMVFADVIITHPLVGSGATVSIPLQPGLPSGFAVWNQWFVLDLPANPFGMTTSNLGRFLIGY
ncbi:MAG: hypothetical protein K8J09_14465 [Planctomycetes bacterium]|nr:hypothetical protein [Planctomycetota bacterium]